MTKTTGMEKSAKHTGPVAHSQSKGGTGTPIFLKKLAPEMMCLKAQPFPCVIKKKIELKILFCSLECNWTSYSLKF